MNNRLKTLSLVILAAGASAIAMAAPLTFDFKDPKGVNNAGFKLDAPLESISGSASGITGTVTFDPDAPGATTGKIVIDSSTLHVPNAMMQKHLQSDAWLDVAKFPEITFAAAKLSNVKTDGNTTSADITGTLSIHGISKEITVPVTLTYLKDKLSQRVPNMNGDLLVIRAKFSVKRSDYQINPSAPSDKVSDTIDLTLSIAGAAAKS